MPVKKISEESLFAWVERMLENIRVEAVQSRVQGKEERFHFAPLKAAEDLRLDYDVTVLPPKKYFQPQKELAMRFDRQARYEDVIASEPFVLLGVHPYDMEAILQMDMVFSKDNCDEHYMAFRSNATIIACDVQSVSPNTFAGSMGTAVISDGFDVLLTRIDNGYVADFRTDKGIALLDDLPDAADASDEDLGKREQVWEENRKRLRKHELLMKPEELPALLEQSYEHPVWEERAKQCYSCGSCTMTCPTCYCFDTRDDLDWNLETGGRYHVWDGCQLQDFAKVAGGHNFRPKTAERYRHRYYRKGKYVWDMIGRIACVGCGRCITACTSFIAHPPEIYNRLWEDRK